MTFVIGYTTFAICLIAMLVFYGITLSGLFKNEKMILGEKIGWGCIILLFPMAGILAFYAYLACQSIGKIIWSVKKR